MSHLENTSTPDPQLELPGSDSVPPPNPGSGKKWLWFGGCGCLIVLLCCGGGGVMIGLPAMGMYQAIAAAKETIVESQSAQDLLGTPIEVKDPVGTNQNRNEITMEFPVSGPKGSGTVKVTIKPASFTDFPITSIILETDGGEEADLLNADEFNIKIEDPDDFEGDEEGDPPTP